MKEFTSRFRYFPKVFTISGALTLLFVVVAVTIMTRQLFIKPIISVADNSDFYRISFQVGISPASGPETMFKYANLHFSYCKPRNIEYASSELIFCSIARVVNRIFVSTEYFDVRSLGLTHVVAYFIALLLFASQARLPSPVKLVFLTIITFILLDDRIVSYFNSFYCESASVIFFLFTLGLMLFLGSENLSQGRLWAGFTVFILSSLLLAFSKSQHLIMLLPLCVFSLCIAWQNVKLRVWRWCWIIMSIFLLLGGLWIGVASHAFAATKGTNIAIVLYDEIGPHTRNFENDLREMHATRDDISKVTIGRILRFYARHPVRYWELLERRATKTFKYLTYGSYTQAESRWPWEQSSKFSIWWKFKEQHYPKNLWFVFGILAVGVIFGVHRYFREADHWQSHLGLVTATLSVMAGGSFLIAATFEANGPEKHLFLFNVLFDFVTVLILLLLYFSVLKGFKSRWIPFRCK